MTTPLPTLKDLFLASGDARAPVTALASAFGGLQWHGLYDHAFDVLDVNVVDVLVGGWKKHADVREALRETAADSSRTAVVQLADHELESTHTPSIEVRSHGRIVANVTFPIELAFEVQAIELVIRQGEVQEIRPGSISARGTMKLERSVILERKLAPIRLPGTVALGQRRAGAVESTAVVTVSAPADAA